jgi:hypothetical protein
LKTMQGKEMQTSLSFCSHSFFFVDWMVALLAWSSVTRRQEDLWTSSSTLEKFLSTTQPTLFKSSSPPSSQVLRASKNGFSKSPSSKLDLV